MKQKQPFGSQQLRSDKAGAVRSAARSAGRAAIPADRRMERLVKSGWTSSVSVDRMATAYDTLNRPIAISSGGSSGTAETLGTTSARMTTFANKEPF